MSDDLIIDLNTALAMSDLAHKVLNVMALNRTPLSKGELCALMSKSDKTVSKALRSLERFGLIRNTGGAHSYQVAVGYAVQLPLAAPIAIEVKSNIKSRNRSDFSSSSSRSSLDSSPDLPLLLDGEKSEKFRLLMLALEKGKVREPALSRLAALPHVTLELVEYHLRTAESLGQAIYRIEHNWPVEAEESDAESDAERIRKKYIEGPYADVVQY